MARMGLGRTSVIYFVSKLLGSALGFVATIYFARVLGEEVIGYFALTLAVVSWLAMVGDVGLSGALIKRVSEGEESEQYLTAGVLVTATLICLVGLAVFAFRGPIDAYVGRPVAGFVLLLVAASLCWSLTNSLLQGSHLVHVYAPLSTAKIGLRSVVGIGLVAAGWGLSGMLAGYAAGWLAITVVGLWVLRPRLALPERRHFRRLVDFAKFSWLGNMRSRAYNEVDIVVLGAFVSSGLVGIYSVAWSLGKFLDVFGMAIKTTLFPEMSERSADDDRDRVGSLTEDALAYAGLFSIPGLVGAAVIGDLLMGLYGPGFVVGDRVLVVLIAGILVYTYTKQLLNALNALDRPDLSFRVNALFIATNVAFNVVLIALYGWIGAAVASVLSAAISLGLAMRYCRSLVPVAVPYGEIGRQFLAAGLMGGVVIAARRVGSVYGLLEYDAVVVVVLVAVGAGTYLPALLVLSSRFRRTVIDNVPVAVPLAR